MTPFTINEPQARQRLEPTPSPYFEPITPTVHVGYRKGTTVTRWVLRRRIAGRYRTHTFKEFIPDDELPANGTTVLSFEQFKARVLTMSLQNDSNHHDDVLVKVCSFCTKSENEVAALVAGANGFICDKCVDIGHAIIEEHRRNPDKDWSNWTPPAG